MTVEKAPTTSTVECVWFDYHGRLGRETFLVSTLRLVDCEDNLGSPE